MTHSLIVSLQLNCSLRDATSSLNKEGLFNQVVCYDGKRISHTTEPSFSSHHDAQVRGVDWTEDFKELKNAMKMRQYSQDLKVIFRLDRQILRGGGWGGWAVSTKYFTDYHPQNGRFGFLLDQDSSLMESEIVETEKVLNGLIRAL